MFIAKLGGVVTYMNSKWNTLVSLSQLIPLIIFFFNSYYFNYVYRECVHTNVGAHRGQRCEIPLELGLQAVVNHLMWVLGINSGPQEEQYVLLTPELSFQLPLPTAVNHFLF